jgi:hypothetical protein
MVEGPEPAEAELLIAHGHSYVFHCAPLHYILFIARSGALLSKVELRRAGFKDFHFRSTSRGPDEQRGFSNYVHLTIEDYPDILLAKLKAGFPHFGVRIPAEALRAHSIHMCRYNIAKTRNLRSGRRPSPERDNTGWFHGGKEIPTAETLAECKTMLANNSPRKMEVLVVGKLVLPSNTELVFFNTSDYEVAKTVLRPLNVRWRLRRAEGFSYTSIDRYVTSVKQYLDRTIADSNWRGDGLGFDCV